MKIWSQSLEKEVEPEKVPLEDLIDILYSIYIETDASGDFLPKCEIEEKYAAIDEAVRRLQESEKKE
jgi:hypothetical protein